jgi:hypothetical protein
MPNSEHNKQLLRDNNYRHGKAVIDKTRISSRIQEKLVEAGYKVPISQ